VFELGMVDDVYFLAMEWVQGATVEELLRQGPLPAAAVTQIGAHIADALHYAHERFGIVHRDVTPRNVIVDAAGYARLLDFGIAARVEHTGSGELFGSPGYMAPEQLRGEGLCAASDLFSLGCVLYEAVSGKPAWPPLRSAAELEACPRAPALELTDETLRELITGLIERDVSLRPQPASQVAERLRAWLSEHHPRGMLSELSDRVAKARALGAGKPMPTQNPPRVSSGRIEVRSIAVSQELTALLAQATERISREERSPEDEAERVRSERPEERMSEDPELHRIARRLLRDLVVLSFALMIALLYPRSRDEDDDSPEDTHSHQLRPATPAPVAAVPETAPTAPEPALPKAETEPETAAAPSDPPAEATAQKRGFLSVSAVPWAEVRVDGRLLGSTPRRSVPLRAGKHTVNLSCPPLAHDATLTVELQPEQELRVSANMHESPPQVTTQ
jgi:serine/threonine-protein kinase